MVSKHHWWAGYRDAGPHMLHQSCTVHAGLQETYHTRMSDNLSRPRTPSPNAKHICVCQACMSPGTCRVHDCLRALHYRDDGCAIGRTHALHGVCSVLFTLPHPICHVRAWSWPCGPCRLSLSKAPFHQGPCRPGQHCANHGGALWHAGELRRAEEAGEGGAG